MGVAVIAQLGERQTEDLEVPGSIPGHGISLFFSPFNFPVFFDHNTTLFSLKLQ